VGLRLLLGQLGQAASYCSGSGIIEPSRNREPCPVRSTNAGSGLNGTKQIIHIRVDVTYRKPRALGFHCGHTLRNPRPRGAVWEPTEGNVPGLPRRPPSSGRAMRTDCARAPARCRQDEAVLGES
jgi:hypothetical protein